MKRAVTMIGLSIALSLPAASAALAETRTYKIDPVHSSVIFRISHLGVTPFFGRFNKIEGTVVLDKENPARSSIDVTIDASSIDTNHERRDNDLKSPDFFNVKQFPAITFKSKKVEKFDEDTYKVTGDLTLRGKTREITFNFDYGGEQTFMEKVRGGGFAEVELYRSHFGMDKFVAEGVVGDKVTLLLGIEGIRQ